MIEGRKLGCVHGGCREKNSRKGATTQRKNAGHTLEGIAPSMPWEAMLGSDGALPSINALLTFASLRLCLRNHAHTGKSFFSMR
jgi:hypothetical protein